MDARQLVLWRGEVGSEGTTAGKSPDASLGAAHSTASVARACAISTMPAVTEVVVAGGADIYYRDRYWNDLPRVVEYLNERATGAPHPGWMHHLLAIRGEPFERALVLNSGNGWVERELIRLGVVHSAVGVEHQPALVEQARSEAEAAGLPATYVQLDTNTGAFPDGPYDLVVNHAAGHHIAYLDRVFRRVAELLPPNGILASWDYVGPHRNQYPAALWEAAWYVNRQLPERFRSQMVYDDVADMIAGDPSEAVHSELLLGVINRYFEVFHHRDLGGPIGYLLLTHNAALLDAAEDEAAELVEQILAADTALVEADPSMNLFAYVLGRPRKSVLEDAAQLSRWTAEEDERELRAAANGGRYYQPTLIAELTAALRRAESALASGTEPTAPTRNRRREARPSLLRALRRVAGAKLGGAGAQPG